MHPASLEVEGTPETSALDREVALGREASLVRLTSALVAKAYTLQASDIHIDPLPHRVRVRMRVDGVLQEVVSLPPEIHQEVISRIKVLANLRTDEHQAAQDGRFREAITESTAIDVRVSIAPTYHGENAVLRLLTDRHAEHTLESLGFAPHDEASILRALGRKSGMILATGPTGSGKTTTLYALVKELNVPEVAIITIEDPIEYSIESVEQIQVNPRTGLTFANGLRSILRQDPDIIMVGEIRDKETAGIAVNTALTGHLLLSTLHTNDAAATLPRLVDMGIDPYLVASTINIAIGQRLVRRLCILCAGSGCTSCNECGYRGRITISEVLVATDAIRDAILAKATAEDIRRLAVAGGMVTMFEDGMSKVGQGLTSHEEVLRVISE